MPKGFTVNLDIIYETQFWVRKSARIHVLPWLWSVDASMPKIGHKH
jgi:hypothetical protein